ncbi:MAG TPA: hypothetical protein VIM30_17290 [Candidatus Limnocylindrales bacterium]
MAGSDHAGDGRQEESKRLAERRRALNRRLRAAFFAGAEEHVQRTTGHALTDEELRWVIRRYPGDVGER